jgi:hypothetical protein
LQNRIPRTKNLTTHPTFTSLQQKSLSQNTDDEGTKQKWRQKDRNGRKRMRPKAEVEAQRKKLQKTDEEQNKSEDRQRSCCRKQMDGQTCAFVSCKRNGFACLFAKTTTGF